MPLKDQIKNYAKKLVEERPDPARLQAMICPRKPLTVKFSDDGIIPNNPRFPVIIYRAVVKLSDKRFDPAVVIDALFEHNGWGRSWRDTVYDFVHYHSQIHEVMGVARGTATLEFGGIKGRQFKVKAGDVAILPAGTGHRLITSSRNFLVVGAYPASGTYDECTDIRERIEAAKRIAKIRRPGADPVFGRSGPQTKLWRGKTR
jgi:uncharacterized protein YjlB